MAGLGAGHLAARPRQGHRHARGAGRCAQGLLGAGPASMLGGIGVAVDPSSAAPGSGDVGRFGVRRGLQRDGRGDDRLLPRRRCRAPCSISATAMRCRAMARPPATRSRLRWTRRSKSTWSAVSAPAGPHRNADPYRRDRPERPRSTRRSAAPLRACSPGSPRTMALPRRTSRRSSALPPNIEVSAVPGRAAGIVLKIPKARLATLPGAPPP